MAHGAPDWSNVRKGQVIYRLDDMAELAVRLGSIVSFDRRGDVLFMDDFENGLNKWSFIEGGSGASADLSTVCAQSGGMSLRVVSGLTTADNISVNLYRAYPVLSRFGMEESFSASSPYSLLDFFLRRFDGTNEHRFGVRYDKAAKTLAYLNASAAWITFATNLDLYAGTDLFHRFKLVIDGEADKYVRLILNNIVYDLSAYSPYVVAQAVNLNLRLQTLVGTTQNESTTVFIDDVILTQNEP